MAHDIRARRSQLQISQSQLARLSGVSRFKICMHELGDKPLNKKDEKEVEKAIRNEAARIHRCLRRIGMGGTRTEA